MTMEFTTIQLRERLDGDRNQLVADLLGGHQGMFHLNGGGSFKLEYVTEGKLTRLAVKRQHAEGASWLQKAKCLAIDLWSDDGQRKLQQAFRHVGGIANEIARDLRADCDRVLHEICPDGQIDAVLNSVGIRPPGAETLAWSAKRAPYSPIALDRLDRHRTRLDDDKLVLTFRHHDDTIQLVFTRHPGEQGERALARLHALATGTEPYAARFGEYADLRQLLAQFVRASVEDEAPAQLTRIARARVLREMPVTFHVDSRGQGGYLYAPIFRSDSAIANETEAAIELAVRRLLPRLAARAAARADEIRHQDGRWPVNARPVVEKYADIAMELAHAVARDQLADHSRKAFRQRVEQQAAATPQECESLKARGKHWGNLGALPVPGRVPRYAAFVGNSEGSPHGMVVMCFQQKVSLMKKLWLNLIHPRAKARAAGANANQVLHAGETRYLRDAASGDMVKRHAVMLRANPAALRFAIGANVRIARSNLADVAAARTYLGLPQLYEQLHTTVYDNHMHIAVVPAVRLAVDEAVRAMRNERRETLAGLLARDRLSEPLAGILGEDARRDVVAAVVALRLAFLEAREAQSKLGIALVHDAAAKKGLRAIAAPTLPMIRAMAQADAAAEAAREAANRAEQALAQARDRLGRVCRGVEAPVLAASSGILEDRDPSLSTHPYPALPQAFASLIPQIDEEHERLMADEAALRQRVDTMGIGKATLGEFNAWTRAEVEHFWRSRDPAADRVAGQAANRPQPADPSRNLAQQAAAEQMAGPPADPPAAADAGAAIHADGAAPVPPAGSAIPADAAREPDRTSRHSTRLARAETAEQVAYWWYLASLSGEPVEPDDALLADGIEPLNMTVLDASGRPQSLGGIDAAPIDEDRDFGPPAELPHDDNRHGVPISVARLV